MTRDGKKRIVGQLSFKEDIKESYLKVKMNEQ